MQAVLLTFNISAKTAKSFKNMVANSATITKPATFNISAKTAKSFKNMAAAYTFYTVHFVYTFVPKVYTLYLIVQNTFNQKLYQAMLG